MRNLLISLVMCTAVTLHASDWPREIQSPEGTITMYQPQIDSFKNNFMSARAAVSITADGATEPVFGAVWLDCRVQTDRPTRIVTLEDVKVKDIKFPKGTGTQKAKIAATLEQELPHLDLAFSLDELLTSLETAQKEEENAEELDVTPPKIIVMDRPAVLVRIDGDPVFMKVEGTSLERVANTPFFLVHELPSARLYLRGGSTWYTATSLAGPWRPGAATPQPVVNLYEQSKTEEDAEANATATDAGSTNGKIPEIIVITEPAELIASDGPIQYSPIKGTGLLYTNNTPAKLFLEIAKQEYYLLVSGRWYTSKALKGSWTYVASDKLPADFAAIPPGSERDDVLANVAGTIPAKEAALDAQIPQTAQVDRQQATTSIQYDGDPQFQPIETTDMEYAVNTSTPVIRALGRYYSCDKGVWFESVSPSGPWGVCINVPNVIYTIPPRCPIYYVRHVRVYSYTPTVAYVGYTAGYTGCYVYRGTVVYGTGYRYHPWVRHYYYPRPWTWGFGVHYDPWTGWSMGLSTGWWQPHGWFAYNWGAAHAGWWGPVGYRPVYHSVVGPMYRAGYHPVRPAVMSGSSARPTSGGTRTVGVTRTPTMYDHWTSGVRRPTERNVARTVTGTSRPSQPPAGTPVPRPPQQIDRGGSTRSVTRPSTGRNDVYAAPDGNVLRKTPSGWQQREQNTWKQAAPAPANQGLNRDANARQRGAERTSTYNNPRKQAPPPAKQPQKEGKGKKDKER